MITQKAISLKIDTKLLEDLDAEVNLGYRSRNGNINRAIACYLSLEDAKRRVKYCYGLEEKRQILDEWLRKWFPESAYWP